MHVYWQPYYGQLQHHQMCCHRCFTEPSTASVTRQCNKSYFMTSNLCNILWVKQQTLVSIAGSLIITLDVGYMIYIICDIWYIYITGYILLQTFSNYRVWSPNLNVITTLCATLFFSFVNPFLIPSHVLLLLSQNWLHILTSFVASSPLLINPHTALPYYPPTFPSPSNL